MADDATTVERLQAELRQLREEVERRDRALDDARERQAATTAILRARCLRAR
jgi:hypothetical protein